VPGFGERKTELYGRPVLDALRRFEQGARATETLPKKRSKPAAETLGLLAQGHTLAEVAAIRGRQIGSVVTIVAEMVEARQVQFQRNWVGEQKVAEIEAACAKVGMERLRPIKDALPADVTFEEIRLVVADLKSRGATQNVANTAGA
jgi:ATP-dependent DNA helicase RecQ